MPRIILASQSPRRQQLLTQMGVSFTATASAFDEWLDDQRPPADMAIELALGKARAVAEQHRSAIVIGSDTIVAIDGHQLGKPADEAAARAVLTGLAGREVAVISSVAVVCLDEAVCLSDADQSGIVFRPLDPAALETYLASGDYQDKAGGISIQSAAGAPLVDCMRGRYDTTLGLPTSLLAAMLQRFGVAARPVELVAPVPVRA